MYYLSWPLQYFLFLSQGTIYSIRNSTDKQTEEENSAKKRKRLQLFTIAFYKKKTQMFLGSLYPHSYEHIFQRWTFCIDVCVLNTTCQFKQLIKEWDKCHNNCLCPPYLQRTPRKSTMRANGYARQ